MALDHILYTNCRNLVCSFNLSLKFPFLLIQISLEDWILSQGPIILLSNCIFIVEHVSINLSLYSFHQADCIIQINSYLKIMNEKVTMAPKTCYVSFKMYIKVRKSILFASQFSDSFEQSRLNRITHWKINERSSWFRHRNLLQPLLI